MSNINFDNIYLLFIAIPLIVVMIIPFCITVRKDNRNGHNVASMVLHIFIAILIAFAFAGTSFVSVVTETNVYVVADVSYSANKNLDVVDQYIDNVKNSLPRNSQMGVICFGKDYELLTDMGEEIVSVKNSTVDQSETNICDALEYAGTLFEDNVIRRIVLITDGKETDQSDSYALQRSVSELRQKKIKVDAIYLDDNITDKSCELQVSNVEYSDNAFLNHNVMAVAEIQSSYAANAIAVLYKNGEPYAQKAVSLTAGSNSVSFDLYTMEAGEYEYEIRIESEEDESEFNNSYFFKQTVTDDFKVLLVTSNNSDYTILSGLFGDNAEIDAYVNKTSVPFTVESLISYDEIIICNVNVSTLKNYTMFIESLDTVVSLFGKSLITIGNTGIQTATEDNEAELEKLEDMLPVRYGNDDQAPKLYTIVMDMSRSMQISSRLIIAKQAATYLVNTLNDTDYVCVVAFYGNYVTIQTPAIVGRSKETVIDKINNISPLQGTFIGLGLEQAYEMIVGLPFSNKQVMLISDGVTYTGEADDPVEVVNNMHANGITVSTLDVGRQGYANTSSAIAGLELMQKIATVGGGSYHLVTSVEMLEGVLFNDLSTEIDEVKVEQNTWVQVAKSKDEVLTGTNIDTVDNFVSGYYMSNKKPSATTVLTVNYNNGEGGTVTVPLYAYWNYGNGRVATYTGDISGNWIKNWVAQGMDQPFFRNILTTNIPSEKIDYPFTLSVSTENSTTQVEMLPASYLADSCATISVTAPDGETVTEELVFDSATYNYSFKSYEPGDYAVALTYAYDGNEYTAYRYFNVPYLPEYDSFAVFDSYVLYRAIGSEGVVSEDGTIDLQNDESEITYYSFDFTAPLMIACVVLYVIDIIIRKLKWNDIKSLFKFNSKKRIK